MLCRVLTCVRTAVFLCDAKFALMVLYQNKPCMSIIRLFLCMNHLMFLWCTIMSISRHTCHM